MVNPNDTDCSSRILGSFPARTRIRYTVSLLVFTILNFGWLSFMHFQTKVDKPILRYKKDGENSWVFKVLQIADIHLGEAEDLAWGPEQDHKTWNALNNIISIESPDLIVLSGDQLTGNNCLENATAYYHLLGDFLSYYSIPWAMIFGNHDDMDFEIPGTNKTIPHKFTRRQLLEVDKSYSLSLSQEGPRDITGTTNYVLNIRMQDNIVTQIYFLDSGGGSLMEAIDDSQIQWLQKVINASKVPAIAFQHIWPSMENFENCHGFRGEGIAPLKYDGGIMQTLANSGRFSFLAVGHNHGNDYCCHYRKTNLQACFGRHSGYGGYGRWDRGSRVYELRMSIDDDDEIPTSLNWKTWVRMESGEIIDEIIPEN